MTGAIEGISSRDDTDKDTKGNLRAVMTAKRWRRFPVEVKSNGFCYRASWIRRLYCPILPSSMTVIWPSTALHLHGMLGNDMPHSQKEDATAHFSLFSGPLKPNLVVGDEKKCNI